MMAPSGPKGLGTSYVIFDETMPVVMNNNDNINNDKINEADATNENNKQDNDNPNETSNSKSSKTIIKGKSEGFFNTFTTILIVILGAIIILIILCLLLYAAKKMKGKDKNSNADSLKQNSTTRILSPNLTDDAFAEDSVYSAVNINNAIPPLPQNPDNYPYNVSVESFNSATSQSGLISRHEAKMIAERFRCELQNPLNNEADDASSIKEKEESV